MGVIDGVGVMLGVSVIVGVCVCVGVRLGVGVNVPVGVLVAVGVFVGVWDGVAVAVIVAVGVGVGLLAQVKPPAKPTANRTTPIGILRITTRRMEWILYEKKIWRNWVEKRYQGSVNSGWVNPSMGSIIRTYPS